MPKPLLSSSSTSAPPVQPSPGDARELLLDVAEREFSVRAFQAVSLREVTRKAGVSLNLVRHHFGSKAGLLAAVHQRLMGPATADRLRTIEALLADEPAPGVEEVFVAAFEPMLRFFHHPRAGERAMFCMRGFFEHEVYWPLVDSTERRIGELILTALQQALSDMPPYEVARRWRVATRIVLVGMLPSSQNVDVPVMLDRVEVEALLADAFLVLTRRQAAPPLEFETLKIWGLTERAGSDAPIEGAR